MVKIKPCNLDVRASALQSKVDNIKFTVDSTLIPFNLFIIIHYVAGKVKIKSNISVIFLFGFDISQNLPLIKIFRDFHLTLPMVAFV
jgi:hypothetical protein